MTDAERLRDLAETLDGYEHLTSGDLCRRVADEIEQLRGALERLCAIWSMSDQANNPNEEEFEPAFADAREELSASDGGEGDEA